MSILLFLNTVDQKKLNIQMLNINIINMKSRQSFQSEKLERDDIKSEQSRKQITIVLQKEGDNTWPISIKQTVEKDNNGGLKLSDIIMKLKKQNFHSYFDSSVSYFHEEKKVYVFSFFLPRTISEKQLQKQRKYQKSIPMSALELKKGQYHCKLKFRPKCKSKLQLLKEEQDSKYENDQQNKKGTKQKEKTIGEVIEKVALWRKLYTGFPNEKDEVQHFQLEDAAKQVGVIKKTLDDYLLQIRNGKRYGFNFHKRRAEKIGELRGFVKDKKPKK